MMLFVSKYQTWLSAYTFRALDQEIFTVCFAGQ